MNRHVSRSAAIGSGDRLLRLVGKTVPSMMAGFSKTDDSPHLLFLGFSFSGTEFDGFRLLRAAAFDCNPLFDDSLVMFDTFWRAIDDDRGPVVRVTIDLAMTPEAAQESVRQSFSEVPDRKPLQSGDNLGDIAFTTGGGAIVFSRGNIVASVSFIRSCNGNAPSVLAGILDQQLRIEQPAFDDSVTLPLVDGGAEIDPAQLAGGDQQPAWYRFWTATGSLARDNRKVIYRGGDTVKHEVHLFRHRALNRIDRSWIIDLH
jgi:hypothetical protein